MICAEVAGVVPAAPAGGVVPAAPAGGGVPAAPAGAVGLAGVTVGCCGCGCAVAPGSGCVVVPGAAPGAGMKPGTLDVPGGAFGGEGLCAPGGPAPGGPGIPG